MAVAALTPAPGLVSIAKAQTPATAQAPATRLIGTISAINGGTLTVKPENGAETTVSVDATTRVLQTSPGAKTLAGATALQLTDLAVGDRVLIAVHPATDASSPAHASTVVAMKSADVAETHAKEAADWQHRGLSGVVQSITPGASGATIVLGTGTPGKTLTLQTSPATTIRRYADDSVSFANAHPATLDQIAVGDQLRALPAAEASGGSIPVEQLVAGSFRNIAGTVVSADGAAGTLTVTDLATKKPVTLRITGETQMRKLPPEMAERLARRAKAGAAGGPPANTGGGAPAGGEPPSAGPGGQPGPGAAHAGDMSNMLSRAPLTTAADLKKGDAVMIVATRGGATGPAAAITLIAGVEPLLQGSSGGGNQDLFSASWNLGGGGAAQAGGEGPQ